MFNVLYLLLNIVRIAFLVYMLLSWIVPQSDFMRTLGRFFEPVLTPVRNLLYRLIPSLRTLPVDLSPLAFLLLLSVVRWLLSLIQRALL